jgi:hypothetical protein
MMSNYCVCMLRLILNENQQSDIGQAQVACSDECRCTYVNFNAVLFLRAFIINVYNTKTQPTCQFSCVFIYNLLLLSLVSLVMCTGGNDVSPEPYWACVWLKLHVFSRRSSVTIATSSKAGPENDDRTPFFTCKSPSLVGSSPTTTIFLFYLQCGASFFWSHPPS